MASIHDLPNEIILEVANCLVPVDDTSQLYLALTCRRFYSAIIHLVLVEQVKEIERLSSTGRILPPLYNDVEGNKPIGPTSEILLFRQSFGTGPVQFSTGGLKAKEIRSLRCLVCHAQTLKKVVIALLVSKPCNLQNVALLVNTCVAKKGLRLYIHGGINGPLNSPFIFDFLQRSESESSIADGAAVDNSLETSDQRQSTFFTVTRRPHSYPTEYGSLTQGKLSTLYLEGGIPFLLPLYPVTIKALNSPTITGLEMVGMPPSLTLFHWGQILPSIVLPSLVDLSIGNLLIPFPDLLSFLERHPTIKALSLAQNNVIGVVKLPPRTNFLPRLSTLTANAEYLLPFINHKKRGYLPALEGVYARPCLENSGPSRYPFAQDEIYPVCDALSCGPEKLDLSFIVANEGTPGLIDWVLDSHAAKYESDTTTIPAIMPLGGVRQLAIDATQLFSDNTTRRLTTWFEKYLSSLNFEGVQQREELENPSCADMMEILIWTTCLRLDTLEIGGNNSTKSYFRDPQLRVTKSET